MKVLAIFLEEPSAREMLRGLLPRVLPDDITIRYIVFEGKQDLEKQLSGKLRGWKAPDTCFLVLRDQDSEDCHEIKDRLSGLCRDAEKTETLVRIACRELESWYFGDLSAVEKGLGLNNIARNNKKAKYRNPDSITNPADELMALTKGNYQKISGSRAIGPHMNVELNTSNSFNVFVSGVQGLFKESLESTRPQYYSGIDSEK